MNLQEIERLRQEYGLTGISLLFSKAETVCILYAEGKGSLGQKPSTDEAVQQAVKELEASKSKGGK